MAAALLLLSLCTARDAWLPINAHVALVGFDGTMPVSAAQLRRLLEASLPLVQPTLVETGEAFEARYVVTYAVHHASDAQRLALQDALVAAARAQPQPLVATVRGAERSVVDVEASRLESAYERLRAELLGSGHGGGADRPGGDDDAYLIVVQHLDSDAISPRLPGAQARGAPPTLHRFRYAGSVPTQAFVGRGRFLVADLSAAPCDAGMLGADEGTVSEDALPLLARPRAGASADEVRLAGALALRSVAALVLRAVRFVLAPSVRFCAGGSGGGGGAARVVVPLIALRNHEDFDPLAAPGAGGAGGADGVVDVAALRAEAERWLPPGQQLELLTSTHPLHAHPPLAVALARALRSATSHELFGGRFKPAAVPFLDAAELLAHLRHSADALGGELLRAEDGAGGVAGRGGEGARAGAAGEGAGASRLLPVYLLSLRDEDPRLVVRANLVGHDHGADATGGARAASALSPSALAHGRVESGLLAVSAAAVLVLQTASDEPVRLGFHSTDGPLDLDGRDATRHVLAGLLGALGGVLPPHESFSRALGRAELDFAWAVGAHPFGPFGRSAATSAIFADVAARNCVLCQMRAVEAQLDAAERAADRLAHDFLRAPLPSAAELAADGGSAAPWAGQAARAWAERAALPDSMAMAYLARLVPPTLELRTDLAALQGAAEARSAPRADIAARLGALLGAASALAARARAEAAAAREELVCCALAHEVRLPRLPSGQALLAALGALCAAGGVLVALQRPRGGASRSSRRRNAS